MALMFRVGLPWQPGKSGRQREEQVFDYQFRAGTHGSKQTRSVYPQAKGLELIPHHYKRLPVQIVHRTLVLIAITGTGMARR
jgi:hypothetical protein